MACLYLCDQTGKHLADVLLMLCTHVGRKLASSTIPRNRTFPLMRKQTHGLPPVSQQNIACQYLLRAETVVWLNRFAGMIRQRGYRSSINNKQLAEMRSLLLWNDEWSSCQRC